MNRFIASVVLTSAGLVGDFVSASASKVCSILATTRQLPSNRNGVAVWLML